MNIWQFRKLLLGLFHNQVMNKLAANLKVEYKGNGSNGGQSIEVYDKNTRIAYMDFDVSTPDKYVYVELVFVAEKYSSQNLALRMFKEFYKRYKADWWGFKIYAEFANNELSKFFQDAVSKGWFPEGVNQTEEMGLTDEEFNNFKGRMNEEVNNRIDALGDIPEPVLRDTNTRKSVLVGYDTVYKNLTTEQLTKLNEYHAGSFENFHNVIMFDGNGGDSYIGFFEAYEPNKDVINKLSIQLLYYPSESQFVTNDLNLITKHINTIQQFFPEAPQKGTIYLYNGDLYNGSSEKIKYTSFDQINQIIEDRKTQASTSRLRRINGGK